VGDRAPEFTALDQHGKPRSSAEWDGRAFVMYFYPKDETPGCIAQGCAFRDAWEDFQGTGVDVVGVSQDSPESHAAFAKRRRLPYTLLADEKGTMHRAYKVMLLGLFARRVSYLIDGAGRVAAVYESNTEPRSHIERMIEAARVLLKI
jgi:peroxiredoxin Q/BCP